MFLNKSSRISAFTLLELLIIIGILAIVGVIVMLIVNPAEMFKQSRDTRRMVDLKNIDSAVRLARTESIFMGNTNIVYISVPDPALSVNATSTCPNMGLPPLDPSWKYNCVSQNNLAKNNGTGWIPINFSSLGVGSPFASLPIDPENTTSSWRYYRYITDSKGKYIAVSGLYSDKYKPEAAKDGGGDSEKFEVGTNMSLWEESKKYYGLVRQSCAGYTNCFTSLNQWESNYSGIPFGSCAQGDLNCVDKIAVAKIDGAWTSADTTAVAINGWTTSVNNYIKIYTTATARHVGKWDTGKYRLEGSGQMLGIYNNFVNVEGIQIKGSQSGWNTVKILAGVGSVRLISNIIRGSNTADSCVRVAWTNGVTVYAYNNVIYECFLGVYSYGPIGYYYNNTVYNTPQAGFAANTVFIVAKNNIVQSSTNGYADGSFNPASDYNISSAAGDTTGGAHDKANATVSFVDATNNDFRLAPTDTAAKDAGKNFLSDPNLSFNNDIEGQVRGPIWDIGADEL